MSSNEQSNNDNQGGPTTNIRLFLRASNLSKTLMQNQPDTYARISVVTPHVNSPNSGAENDGDGGAGDIGGENSLHSGGHSLHHQVLDETEVVQRSSNPRWTKSFTAEYIFGSQLLFFVDVFAVRTNARNSSQSTNRNGSKLLGRAVFDVQDVLGTKNHIKARRLRKGGVVYAHIEQQSSRSTFPPPTIDRRSLYSSTSPTPNSSQHRILTLRLRAHSLVHSHSTFRDKLAPATIAKPDTYFELSRPSSQSSQPWIVVYRSSVVKESVSPLWDEASIDLDSLAKTPSSGMPSSDPNDLSSYPVMITVYKIKTKKCKPIGSFETTIQSLVECVNWYATSTRIMATTGYEEVRPSQSIGEEEEKRRFLLRSSGNNGANVLGEEITGKVTVVTAQLEGEEEVWQRSQRFLMGDQEKVEDVTPGMYEMESDHSAISSVSSSNAETRSAFSNGSSAHTPAIDIIGIPTPFPQRQKPKHAKFSDYASAGLDIDFCVAIDFTSSNGDPRIPGTLHYSRDGMMNDYEEAMEAIGGTISKYSSSQDFPVWGFGAKYAGEVRHIFQCGNQSTVKGIQGVLDAYRTVFESDLTLSGPTVVLSVLQAAAARSKKLHASNNDHNKRYCVLLILTDGMVTDLPATKEWVRAVRELPLSIVVVGIGRADFTEMHEWHCAPPDERGGFSFVEFREHQFDPMALSRKALEKVPHDVVDYFAARNILP